MLFCMQGPTKASRVQDDALPLDRLDNEGISTGSRNEQQQAKVRVIG